jgi:hypothetical protein
MKNTLTIDEIRRRNLQLLIDESDERTTIALARKCKVSHTNLSQIKNQFAPEQTGTPRMLGSKLARKLELGCGKPEGWMDISHADDRENELRDLYASMDETGRALLLQQAQMILKIGK